MFMLLRRTAATVTAALLLWSGAAPTALADPSPSADSPAPVPDSLYGAADPTHDGVWRQSLVLLAQHAAGLTPAEEAVRWLVDQQCADGAFAAYRAQPDQPCDAGTTGDTNATAAAVQALASLGGQPQQVDAAVRWLREQQNPDGGWGYAPGGASDANSLSVVIGALVAAGQDPAKVRPAEDGDAGRPSAYDALAAFQLDCAAAEKERGSFTYQPDEKSGDRYANDAATVAAIPAAFGEDLVVEPDRTTPRQAVPRPLDCPAGVPADDAEPAGDPVDVQRVAEGGAAYLLSVLEANDGHLTSVLPGSEDQPDYGNTALAVVALAAGGYQDAARPSLSWLEKHSGGWEQAQQDPAALAYLVLAAQALGEDPSDFGGRDLIAALNATGPAPSADRSEPADRGESASEEASDGGNGGVVTGVVIALVLVAAAVAVVWTRRARAARRS